MMNIKKYIVGILILAALTMAAPAAHAQNTTSNLVGHWTLDETAGTTAADSAGTNNGTMNGGLDASNDSVGGQIGTALNFDGTNDYVALGTAAALGPTANFTVSAWVYTAGGVEQAIYSAGDVDQNYWAFLISAADQIFVRREDGGAADFFVTTDLITPNAWNHVAVTKVAGGGVDLAFYINGQPAQTFNTGGTWLGSGNKSLGIRLEGPSGPFNGMMDDVRLYDRALTAEDITALYLGGPGTIRYNNTHNVMEYQDGTQWIAMGQERYVPNAVNFDDVNDYLTSGGALTGVVDGKTGTVSLWFKYNSGLAIDDLIFGQDLSRGLSVRANAADEIQIVGKLDDNTVIFDMQSSAYVDDQWHHLLASWDLTDPAKRHIYIDGISDLAAVTTYIDDFIDYTRPDSAVGSFPAGPGAAFNGDLADVYILFNTYIDLSVAANRAKFYNGGPVYLGADGSKPTGTAPDIFLSGDTAGWSTNKGTGGGFTENGALTTAPSPSENNYTWQQIGNSASPPGINGLPALAAMNSARIAFYDNVQDSIIAMDWDGTNWTTVGNALIDPAGATACMVGLDSETIAYSNAGTDEIQTYRFDGTDWTQIGNGYSLTWNTRCAFAALDSTTVAFITWDNDNLLTLSWDGTDWTQIGNALAIAGNEHPAMDLIDNNIIAFIDGGNEDLRTYSWDGTDWTQVGNELNIAGAGVPAIATLEDNKVAFMDSALDQLQVYEWNGTDWLKTGTDLDLTGAGDTRLVTLKNNTVALYDQDAPSLLYTYGFTYCTTPSRPMGSITYNTTSDQMQFCNGVDWIAMGPPGDGGAGCSNPAGTAGSLTYNTVFRKMQYCEGDTWIGIGGDGVASSLLSGLVAHWPLDESSGTNVPDISGNGNNGTSSDATPAWLPTGGVVSGALDIDSDETITAGTWDVSGTGITMSGWLYLESATQDPRIICKTSGFTDSDSDWCWLWDNGTGEMEIRITTINGFQDNRTNGLDYFNNYGNQWHHFAITYDASTDAIVYYLDGTQFDTDTHVSGGALITGTGETVALGNNSVGGTREWDGLLDDLRVYDRPLSAAEVTALYNQADCPNIGDACSDGSIYIGQVSGNDIYATAAASQSSQTWNFGTTTWTVTGFTSTTDGRANTAGLVALSDAGSPYDAAVYCNGLTNVHGRSDWYLPAQNELNLLWNGGAPVAGVLTDGTFYWSSTEFSNERAEIQRFSDSFQTTNQKHNTWSVRCMRRD